MHPEFINEDIMALFKGEVEDEDRDKWVVRFEGWSSPTSELDRAIFRNRQVYRIAQVV